MYTHRISTQTHLKAIGVILVDANSRDALLSSALHHLTIGLRHGHEEDYTWVNFERGFYFRHLVDTQPFLAALCQRLRDLGFDAQLSKTGGGPLNRDGCILIRRHIGLKRQAVNHL